MAAASFWYQFWFDVIHWGKYTRKIRELHQQYGPIIRITPDELHCNDPNFIDTIYAHGRAKRDKPAHAVAGWPLALRSVKSFGFRFLNGNLTKMKSAFATTDHDCHHIRRTALNKYFSRKKVSNIESLLCERVQSLCDKLLKHRGSGPFSPKSAYCCFAKDVVISYCFGDVSGSLTNSDLDAGFEDAGNIILKTTHLARYIPGLVLLMDWMPISFLRRLPIKAAPLMEHVKQTIPNYVIQAISAYREGIEQFRDTLITSLLGSELPVSEKTASRLTAESNVLIFAGLDAPAAVLEVITYHLLSNQEILYQLHKELSLVVPDELNLPAWSKLESLPYLSAIIHEGLRLMHGVSGRIALIPKNEDLSYNGTWHKSRAPESCHIQHDIPRGFAVGMSAYLTHMDESVFPEPSHFAPKRWFNTTSQRHIDLKRYLCSFSKGSRQCVGMQLAYCELYLAVTALTLRVLPHMQLYKTTAADIEYDHDEVIAVPKANSLGLRVVVN